MDPLSALSVAAGVVAFLDFGGRVLTRYVELQRSGDEMPVSLQIIRSDIEGLQRTAGSALDRVRALRAKYPTQVESLNRLAGHCQDTHERMGKALQALVKGLGRNPGSKRSRAVMAAWSVSKESEFEELKLRMSTIREEMMMNLLVCLW
jgi:hypothetical protein